MRMMPVTRRGSAVMRRMSVRPGNARIPLLHSLLFPLCDEAPKDPLSREPRLARVEAALMLADEPLTSRRLAEVAGLPDGHAARHAIEDLRELYESDGSAFQIVDVAGGFQLFTRPSYQSWLVRLQRTGRDLRLTDAAMETLAVIAYKQPVMRAEIEAIRGVNCLELIHLLMEKGLVRITGRHDSLGRPQLFGTSKRFLQVFGLNRIDELPEIESLRRPS